MNLNSFGIVMAKINPNLDVLWMNQLTTSTGKVYDLAYLPKSNSIVAVGTFNQQLDFDPSGGTFQLSAFAYDGFVAHYAANDGKFGCAFKIGGQNALTPLYYDDVAYSVESAGGNEYYVYGVFSDTTDFEPGPSEFLKTVGAGKQITDYLAKYELKDCGSLILSQPDIAANVLYLKIYPNPSNNVLFVETNRDVQQVEIYDVNGRRLLVKNVSNEITAFDVSYLLPGVYLCKAINDGVETVKRFIKTD